MFDFLTMYFFPPELTLNFRVLIDLFTVFKIENWKWYKSKWKQIIGCRQNPYQHLMIIIHGRESRNHFEVMVENSRCINWTCIFNQTVQTNFGIKFGVLLCVLERERERKRNLRRGKKMLFESTHKPSPSTSVSVASVANCSCQKVFSFVAFRRWKLRSGIRCARAINFSSVKR